jgi:hypothetical protein
MPTLIQVLADILRSPEAHVECGENSMLVTVRFTNGRKQVVKVRYHDGRYGRYGAIHYQTRVCTATSPSLIRQVLQANAENEWGGYALDTSVTPPMIDLVYALPIPAEAEVNPADVISALQHIATVADTAEAQFTGMDAF